MGHRGEDVAFGASGPRLLLDEFAGASRLRRRFPADAVGDDSTGWRHSLALGQHVHLEALRAAVLEQGDSPEQAANGHQDKELRLRIEQNLFALYVKTIRAVRTNTVKGNSMNKNFQVTIIFLR